MRGTAPARRGRAQRVGGVLLPVLRPVVVRAALAAALGLVVAVIGGYRENAAGTGGPIDAAAAWLRVPMFLVAVTAVVTTIEAWPGFGRDRGSASTWIARARLRPAGGTGVAAGVGISVALFVLGLTGLVFEAVAGRAADRRIRAVEVLANAEPQVLGPSRAARFDLPGSAAARGAATLEVRARPGFVPGQALVTPPLEIQAAGVPVGSIAFPQGFGLGRLDLPAGFGSPLELRVTSGEQGFAVLGPDAVRLTRVSGRSRFHNAVLAALTAAVPVAAALALAVLLRTLVGRATLLLAAVGVVMLGFGTGSLGVPAALDAYARAEEVDLLPFSATRAPDRGRG